jgi:hypothetical protein
MPAFIKVYTDSAHTSEVAHTTNASATINGTLASGSTSITLTGSLTSWPTAGTIDIIDGTNGNETIEYYGLSGQVIQLAKATGVSHATGLTVNQWYYQLGVGDQTNGIANDGTNFAPNSPTNVGTWYLYNAGDQNAQNVTVSTSNAAPSTTSGFADTVVSTTSAASGFATSQNLGTINPGATSTQIWVAAEIPSGQSIVGNPQLCVINIAYSTI